MAKGERDIATNRKARHLYEILDTFEAGMVLQGTEIKSLRENGASLQEAYIKVISSELLLIGASIAPYRHGNVHNHEERRDRKLLVHKKELRKLEVQTQEKGLTLVPLRIYLKNGRAKLEFAVGRGKKNYDKRHAIKERDEKRSIQRAIKDASR